MSEYIPTHSIYRILKDNTDHKVSQEASKYLAQILELYAIEVSQLSKQFTIASERKTVQKTDIIQALKITKIEVTE